MNWINSPTKIGELYYVYEPIHFYIDYHPAGYYDEPSWCLSSDTLKLSNVRLKTKDLEEAKKMAEKIVLEKASLLKKDLDNLLKILEN